MYKMLCNIINFVNKRNAEGCFLSEVFLFQNRQVSLQLPVSERGIGHDPPSIQAVWFTEMYFNVILPTSLTSECFPNDFLYAFVCLTARPPFNL
jgi:hypothetical protein